MKHESLDLLPNDACDVKNSYLQKVDGKFNAYRILFRSLMSIMYDVITFLNNQFRNTLFRNF